MMRHEMRRPYQREPLLPCPCGTKRQPRSIRLGSKSYLYRMQCPKCGFKTPGARIEDGDAAWNAAVTAYFGDAGQGTPP
jgi:predicted RNA-binding Zn-ribbon protein involved in translation (DUF1610 family)